MYVPESCFILYLYSVNLLSAANIKSDQRLWSCADVKITFYLFSTRIPPLPPPHTQTHTPCYSLVQMYSRNRFLITCDVLMLDPSTFVWLVDLLPFVLLDFLFFRTIQRGYSKVFRYSSRYFFSEGGVHMYYVSI